MQKRWSSFAVACVALILGVLCQSEAAEQFSSRGLLLHAAQVVEEISDISQRDYALQLVAVAHAQVGDLSTALKTVERIQQGDHNSVFGEIAQARARTGDMKGALEAIARIQAQDVHIQRSSFTFPPELLRGESLKFIAIDQAKAGNTELATQTALHIPHVAGKYASQQKGEALEGIAVAQAHAKDAKGALTTANAIEEKFRRTSTLTRIDRVFVDAGDVKNARDIAALIDVDQVADKGWALCRIAEAQVRNGDVTGAKQTVRDAIELALSMPYGPMRGGLLGCVARALVYSGDLQKAEQIAVSLPNDSLGSRDNAFKQIAEAQAAMGNGTAALATAAHIQKEQTKNWALVDIAAGLSKAGDLENAMSAVNVVRDETAKASALLNISRGQMSAGDLSGAQRTISLITSTQHKSLPLQELTEVQLKNGDIQGARETALLNQGGSRTFALGAVIRAQAKAGDFNAALEMTTVLPTGIERGRMFQEIARSQTRGGQMEAALDWSNRLHLAIEKAMAFIGMAQGLTKE
jgi:hypothetical protein